MHPPAVDTSVVDIVVELEVEELVCPTLPVIVLEKDLEEIKEDIEKLEDKVNK